MKFILDIFFEIAICFEIVGIDDMFWYVLDQLEDGFQFFFLRKFFFCSL